MNLDDIILDDIERNRSKPFASLEHLITSPLGFGLETATPLQRAVCRIADGTPLGDLATHPHVVQAVGDVSVIDGVRPNKIILLAGIRTFKSLFTAAAALWACLTCNVSMLRVGEVPRFSVLSLRKDLADVIMRHLIGTMLARDVLKPLLVGEPKADTVLIRHPSGCPVEVKIVAGSKAGGAIVARWSAGIANDEAPRMAGQEEGVVNLEDTRDAVEGRLLDGAQQFEIGSPWAPYGPLYDSVLEHEKQPSKDCVVIRARADLLNPYWWTPERSEALRRRSRRAYQTDFLALFADPDETLFGQELLDEICTEQATPRVAGQDYRAAMDPATRTNAWTLVVFTRTKDGKVRQVLARQWVPDKTSRLKPKAVLVDIRDELATYGLDSAVTDQWAADALADIADDLGFSLVIREWTATNRTKQTLNLSKRCEQGDVLLIDDPYLQKDLLLVKSQTTSSGVRIIMPKTPDGRHCDYAPAIVAGTAEWLDEPYDVAPEPDAPEYGEWVEKQIEDKLLEEHDDSDTHHWWD